MHQRKQRLNNRFEVSISPKENHDFVCFHTLNISSTGALVASYKPYDMHKKQVVNVCIDFWLEHLPKNIKCQAKVVRVPIFESSEIKDILSENSVKSDISSVFGIKFIDMTPEDQSLLNDFIAHFLNQNP